MGNASCRGHADSEDIKIERRKLTLGIFKLHPSDLAWHWGLAVDGDFYEVGSMGGMNVPMSILHPGGVIGHSVESRSRTRDFYTGYIELDDTTEKHNNEILQFVTSWASEHPVYSMTVSNCQDFVVDLHSFLTGKQLPYRKDMDRLPIFVKKGVEGATKGAGKGPLGAVVGAAAGCSSGIMVAGGSPKAASSQEARKPSPNMSSKVHWQDKGNDPVTVGAAISRAALQTFPGQYLKVTDNSLHHGALVQTSAQWKAWETFACVQPQGQPYCYLKTWNDLWLSVTPDGKITTAERAREWERFVVEPHGNRCALKSWHGSYISAPPGVGQKVKVAKEPKEWELFTKR